MSHRENHRPQYAVPTECQTWVNSVALAAQDALYQDALYQDALYQDGRYQDDRYQDGRRVYR
ncbi:hypothetical protein [Novipirellula maiorica]|uniref:hypothetical protein n=1 Tax=Novipirellula maiorica TaxID=1265734 RepID=UPI001360B4BA|nr:hypothetical protein [Rhodopirellula maiorica]